VGAPDEDLPDVTEENRQVVAKHREETAALKAVKAAEAQSEERATPAKKKVRAKPAARRVAREAGIDLVDVAPSDGKIVTEEDVRTYLASKENES